MKSKIIAPEKNYDFTELREACKKLRNVEEARTKMENLAKPRKGRPAVMDPSQLAVLLAPYKTLEGDIVAGLEAGYYREVPRFIQEWVDEVPGLGVKTVARLLGELGHPRHATPARLVNGDLLLGPEFHRTLRQWWSYSGNGDITKQPGRNFVGEMSQEAMLAGGRAEGRKKTHVIAQSCIKLEGKVQKNNVVRTRSPYRDVYDEAKAQAIERGWDEQTRRVPYPANRADMHAFRMVRKAILRDLFDVAKGTCC